MRTTALARLSGSLVLFALALAAAPLANGAVAPAGAAKAPFDRAFIDAMVPHHRSAIQMAVVAKKEGLESRELRGIANAIIAAQGKEITTMIGWRKAWYGSARIDPSGADDLGLSERERGMDHDASELRRADDVDAAFATLMIGHHQGAVRMARLALTRATHPQLKQLARRIIATQAKEITVLRKHADGGHGGH